MGSLQQLRCKIRKEFYEAQFKSIHTQGINALKTVYEEHDFEDFMKVFIQCLIVPLSQGEKHVSIERTLDFAAKFCVSFVPDMEENEQDETTDPLLNGMFRFLFKSHQSANETVRFRVCQFANRLLASMPPNAGLDTNTWNQLHSCMSKRLKDKKASIRAQAVMALQRLQDPSDDNCSVIEALKFHLSKDPSAEVRQAVLSIIAATNSTVMDVVLRTRDVSEAVRRHAYAFLAEKVDVRVLSIHHRERILKAGLNDRSENVSSFVRKVLLSEWLKSFDDDVLKLLASFDVVNWTDADFLETVLKCFFNKFEIENLLSCLELNEETKTVPLENLSPERALLWRYMAQYLDQMDDEKYADKMEKVLPNLSPMCEYIRSFFSKWPKEAANEEVSTENLERYFILSQLIEMTKLYDYSGEIGRSNLKDLLVDLIVSQSVRHDLMPMIVASLDKVIPNLHDFIELISDLVEKVHRPSIAEKKQVPEWDLRERKIKSAKIRLDLNTERERQEDAIREKNFLLAESIEEKISELQNELENLSSYSHMETNVVKELNDPLTLLKCLEMIVRMLQSMRVTSSTPTITNLREEFVLQCVTLSESYPVHSKSLEALGLCCILDERLAKEYFVFFFCVITKVQDDDVELGVSALKAIFDILLLCGVEPFDVSEVPDGLEDPSDLSSEPSDDLEKLHISEDSENKKKSVKLINMLTSFLDHKHSKIKSVAVEGLCKLLFVGKIVSPELLSRLVLLWYTPISDVEQENYYHQLMGTFFPAYAMHHEGAQEALASASLLSLRTLAAAPETSPLANVELMSVACFFLDLTRPGISVVEPEINMHNHMGIAFSQEVFESEDDPNMQLTLVRCLSLMDISLEDESRKQQYLVLYNKLIESISDRICLRYLKKFYKKLEISRQSSDGEKTRESIEEEGVTSNNENPRILIGHERASLLTSIRQSLLKGDGIQVIGPSDSEDDDLLENITNNTEMSSTIQTRKEDSMEEFEIPTLVPQRKRKIKRKQ